MLCVRKSILLYFFTVSQRLKYFLRSNIFAFYLRIQFTAEPVFSESVLQFREHPARKSPASCLPAQSIRNLCSPLLPVSPDLSDCLSVFLKFNSCASSIPAFQNLSVTHFSICASCLQQILIRVKHALIGHFRKFHQLTYEFSVFLADAIGRHPNLHRLQSCPH